MSARVVAVSRLMIDVLHDFLRQRDEDLTASEKALRGIILDNSIALVEINAAAMLEMGAQIVKVLET